MRAAEAQSMIFQQFGNASWRDHAAACLACCLWFWYHYLFALTLVCWIWTCPAISLVVVQYDQRIKKCRADRNCDFQWSQEGKHAARTVQRHWKNASGVRCPERPRIANTWTNLLTGAASIRRKIIEENVSLHEDEMHDREQEKPLARPRAVPSF